MSRRVRASIYGAVAGALLGLVFLVFWTGRGALASIDGVLAGPAAGTTRAEFAVSSGGLYMLVVLSALLGGLAIAGIAYALGREAEPLSPRFPLRYLLPAAAIGSVVVAYAVTRTGLGAAADIEAGVVTVSAFRMTVIAAAAGAGAGAITAGAVGALARPVFLGLEGEAWPTSGRAVLAEMMRAVGAPTVAIVVVAALAIGLAQLLLAIEGTGAVAVFGIAAGIILFGAAFVAYRPWERQGQG